MAVDLTIPSLLKAFFRPRGEWVLVAFAIVSFGIASNTQTGWLYIVVACLVALLAIGFITPRLTLRTLEVTRLALPSACEGDTVTIRLRVRNPSKWPRFLVTLTEFPPFADRDGKPRLFLIGCIPATGGVTIEYPVECRFRGAMPLGVVTLQSATPLGLFPATRKLAVPDELVVHPRRLALSRLDFISVTPRSASSARTFQRAGHSYDFQGIREYQFGDDIRLVHWPTTARIGRLMLREFRESGAQRTVVLIDNGRHSALGAPGRTALDDAARFAATVVHRAQQDGAHVTLAASDENGRTAFLHNARVGQAMDWLTRLQPSEAAPPWSHLVEQAVPHVERGGRLLVVAASPLEPEDMEQLHEARLQLFVLLLQTDSYGGLAVDPDAWRSTASMLTSAGATVRRHEAEHDLSRALGTDGKAS